MNERNDWDEQTRKFHSAIAGISEVLDKVTAEDYPELLANSELPAELLDNPKFTAAVLMAILPFPDEPMNLNTKKFWLEVADELGPDWAASVKEVSIFITRNA